MGLTRRRVLGTAGVLGAVTVAGCSRVPILGSDMQQDGELGAHETPDPGADAAVVSFADLPSAERALLDDVIRAGVVRICMRGGGERADALRSFAHRLPATDSYLDREGTSYALSVRVEDQVYAATTDGSATGEDRPPNPCD